MHDTIGIDVAGPVKELAALVLLVSEGDIRAAGYVGEGMISSGLYRLGVTP